MPATDECGASLLGGYLGQSPGTDVTTAIRSTIAHDRIRFIRPDDAVTMDYRSDRLNVEVGADGRIKLFRCG
jgi:hypothetical protein